MGTDLRLAWAIMLNFAACAAADDGFGASSQSDGSPKKTSVSDAAVQNVTPPNTNVRDAGPQPPMDVPYRWYEPADAPSRPVFATGTPSAFWDGGLRITPTDAGTGGTAPPARLCRRETEPCQVSSDCCTGVSCQKGRCARGCGDGVCGSDESPATCCRDCACGSGTLCSPATLSCMPPSVLMSFFISHACVSEPGPINARLFDDSNRLVFPGGTDSYRIQKDSADTFTIACVAGDRICFGLEGASGKNTWGVGLLGDKACTGCCRICGLGDVTLNLVCK